MTLDKENEVAVEAVKLVTLLLKCVHIIIYLLIINEILTMICKNVKVTLLLYVIFFIIA